ncbi:MAG: molybdenum cofactor guanylyltransferase [Deltaproteobacteria bacterium]|nr:molybdenum cofactor guanylyltransferase [Deltaproteobacteria bacterium]
MGQPKGLLSIPGRSEPILEALVRRGREAGFEPVLVGEATPYAGLAEGVLRLEDDPPGAGPLAGLHAALGHALKTERSQLVAIACDMPFVNGEALAEARDHVSTAIVVAPKRGPGAPWEPMLARYDAVRLADTLAGAISRGERSFQKLFASIDVEALPLSEAVARSLEDWDRPEDLLR